MNTIYVPIQYHVNGLHDGHRKLYEYAKQYGNPEFLIAPSFTDISKYYLEGIPIPPLPQVMKNLGKDVSNLKAKMKFFVHSELKEENRLILQNRVRKFLNPFIDVLLIDEYKKMAEVRLMAYGNRVSIKGVARAENHGISIRGPEPIWFFLNKVLPLIGREEYIIMPISIKHPELKIRVQSVINRLSPSMYNTAKRFRYVIDGIKRYYSVGTNDALKANINEIYFGRGWTIKDILVYEGDWISGRLEVTRFALHDTSGILIIEEIEYYA